MAGSIADNAKVYSKVFKYVPPTPPAHLMNSTNFTLHFNNRKFIHIGIDPTDKFNVRVHIITSSRYVNISPDLLRRVFSMMGHILSFILDQTVKYKRTLFLESDILKLSSMVYSGENVLVIETKNQEGCRILLNRADLLQMQELEWCIFDSINQKCTITRPKILNHIDEFGAYIKEITATAPPENVEEMINVIKNVKVYQNIPMKRIYANQVKMFAAVQLAEICETRRNAKDMDELNENLSMMSPISPLSPRFSPINMEPYTQTNMEPYTQTFDMINHADDKSDNANNGFDQNDGPDFFDTTPTSSSTYTHYPATVRKTKRRLF
ncbi:uncharacterized protein LOC126552926 [Aphis gossypii]|uniref:uncharacterized protein LOC126552926 n=1 Tax=Aphis gossypii TaxID=80765 RepID=UPI002158E866|nr:uncharacterized protein LOC126552926 [Aphis gossypii]